MSWILTATHALNFSDYTLLPWGFTNIHAFTIFGLMNTSVVPPKSYWCILDALPLVLCFLINCFIVLFQSCLALGLKDRIDISLKISAWSAEHESIFICVLRTIQNSIITFLRYNILLKCKDCRKLRVQSQTLHSWGGAADKAARVRDR